MATTTNYSWTTPDDTALVKDGAAAIRSLGTAIDTTVFNNAGAAIAKTIVDAKGDIIAATAADTVARLAVGANDTVLTADSSTATGLKWGTISSGGMTLLSTTTLSGASTTISSISQSYKQLVFIIYGMTADTSNGQFYGALNNNTTANSMTGTQRGVATTSSGGKTVFTLNNTLRTDANNVWFFQVDNYTSTTNYKPTIMYGRYLENDSTNNYISMAGAFLSNSAITSIVFDYSGGNFASGTVLTYGVS